MKKFVFLVLIIFVGFLLLGTLFKMPSKKIVEKVVIEDPKVIFETKIVEKQVDMKGESITLHGVGIYNDSTDGEIIDIIMTVKEGYGKSYFDVTQHFFSEDIQESIAYVRANAELFTGVNMNTKDIYVHVDLTTSYVAGTSASAYMTVALIALLSGQNMREDALMTGTIDEYGRIIPVGQITEKVKVVEKSSEYKKVVVPFYNCNEAEKAAKGSALQVACVSTLSEAVDEMIQ